MNSVSVTLKFSSLAAMIAHFSGDTSAQPVFTSVNTPAHDDENDMAVNMYGSSPDEDDETLNTAPPATDSAGMPWDERIHAPSKGTIKDGTWRAKKGVSDELKAQVTAELSATTAPPMPTAQPTPQATTAPQSEFQSFMEKMQPIMQSGAVDAAYLSGLTSEIAGAFAQPLSAITDIASNPQMINFAIQAMQRDGKWTA